MRAIIPQKDTLLALCRFQSAFIKKILLKENDAVIIPLKPLWIFAEVKTPVSLTINFPATDGNFFFFPVQIEQTGEKDSIHNYRIDFAKICTLKTAPESFLISDLEQICMFPRKEKSARTAAVTFENNCWSVFDDRWNKFRR